MTPISLRSFLVAIAAWAGASNVVLAGDADAELNIAEIHEAYDGMDGVVELGNGGTRPSYLVASFGATRIDAEAEADGESPAEIRVFGPFRDAAAATPAACTPLVMRTVAPALYDYVLTGPGVYRFTIDQPGPASLAPALRFRFRCLAKCGRPSLSFDAVAKNAPAAATSLAQAAVAFYAGALGRSEKNFATHVTTARAFTLPPGELAQVARYAAKMPKAQVVSRENLPAGFAAQSAALAAELNATQFAADRFLDSMASRGISVVMISERGFEDLFHFEHDGLPVRFPAWQESPLLLARGGTLKVPTPSARMSWRFSGPFADAKVALVAVPGGIAFVPELAAPVEGEEFFSARQWSSDLDPAAIRTAFLAAKTLAARTQREAARGAQMTTSDAHAVIETAVAGSATTFPVFRELIWNGAQVGPPAEDFDMTLVKLPGDGETKGGDKPRQKPLKITTRAGWRLAKRLIASLRREAPPPETRWDARDYATTFHSSWDVRPQPNHDVPAWGGIFDERFAAAMRQFEQDLGPGLGTPQAKPNGIP